MANHIKPAKQIYTRMRKAKLPYISRRRHMKLPVMGNLAACLHALSVHEDIRNPVTGRDITISYALPCVKKHVEGVKPPLHRDATGREWT